MRPRDPLSDRPLTDKPSRLTGRTRRRADILVMSTDDALRDFELSPEKDKPTWCYGVTVEMVSRIERERSMQAGFHNDERGRGRDVHTSLARPPCRIARRHTRNTHNTHRPCFALLLASPTPTPRPSSIQTLSPSSSFSSPINSSTHPFSVLLSLTHSPTRNSAMTSPPRMLLLVLWGTEQFCALPPTYDVSVQFRVVMSSSSSSPFPMAVLHTRTACALPRRSAHIYPCPQV